MMIGFIGKVLHTVLKKTVLKKAVDSTVVGGVVAGGVAITQIGMEAEDPLLTAIIAIATALARFVYLQWIKK